MFGVMGTSAAFMRAAGAHKKEEVGNVIRFTIGGYTTDPSIEQLSCTGEITVKSIKNGSVLKETYTDLSNVHVSIRADAGTEISIIGDVTYMKLYQFGSGVNPVTFSAPNHTALTNLNCSTCTNLKTLDLSNNVALTSVVCNGCPQLANVDLSNDVILADLNLQAAAVENIDLSTCVALSTLNLSGCSNITTLNLSANTALTTLNIQASAITGIDLSNNTSLTTLKCGNCAGLTTLDLSNNTALVDVDCWSCSHLTSLNLSTNTNLTSLICNSCVALTEIKYPAMNSDVATAVADAITAADAADGTVYTDSAADYYSTIANAATAKGWTIAQIPE